MPTVPTFAVRETDVSRYNGGTCCAPLKPLRDDSAYQVVFKVVLIVPQQLPQLPISVLLLGVGRAPQMHAVDVRVGHRLLA